MKRLFDLFEPFNPSWNLAGILALGLICFACAFWAIVRIDDALMAWGARLRRGR